MAFLGLQTIAFAQQPTSGNKSLIKEKFHFKLPGNQDTEGGYTQAIRVGNTIYVSGTVTLDKNEKGVDHVYKVISKTLEHYGAGLQHVVKEGLYTTDIETMKSLNHVRKKWYKGDYPTSTWLQVSRLYMSEAWLEIEVTAILPE
jgi:enamine deaminase RidA (YjgF/YER057c/UK114 family)